MARNTAAYDADLYAWTQEQARLLREGRTGEIDAENVAAEIDSLGRKDRCEQRRQIAQLLADSPSLRATLEGALPSIYADAREDAADDTGRDPGAFPGACPYSLADALDRDFWPGAPPNGEAGR